MRTTFVNTISSSSILKENIRQFSRFFNPLGKIQQIENVVLSLEENTIKLEDKSQMLERQKSEIDEIRNSINEISTYQTIRASVGSAFNVNDIVVLQRKNPALLKLKSVNFYGLSSKFERIEFPEEINLTESKLNYIYENKECSHTEIVIQLLEGEYCQSSSIEYPQEKILKLKSKSDNTNYVDGLSGENGFFFLVLIQSFIGRRTGTYINWPLFESQKPNMFSIILENYKIGEKPYINTEINFYKDIETNDSDIVKWDSETPISSIQFIPLNANSEANILFSGLMEIEQAVYPIELPAILGGTDLLCGELKVTKKENGATEGYCKYPVDLTQLENIIIFNDLKAKQPIPYLISLDAINWFSIEGLPENFGYTPEYRETPKLCYFRVNGLYESLYINYNLNNNINCAWPLSSDGRLFFDGNGLSIINPKIIRLEGRMKGGLITDSGQLLSGNIMGALGVK
jgi:hypothetical protein